MRKFWGILLFLVLSVTIFSQYYDFKMIVSKSFPKLDRECDESLTEPVVYAKCTKWEEKPGYLDSTCLNICQTTCQVLPNRVAVFICSVGCYGACWKPESKKCLDWDVIRVYPCNWGY
ncbi:hypothetical protein [Thermosipho globiformans]|uniref:hypothetical protein n=1 Tax=Thermosipho globiformans TaxID=380685 RepID=UPI000F8D05DF|nr:hypothetical protein [Thermosipho globiformans]